VRLYSRNAYDWTVRLAAIAAAAEQIKAKSFTIDGEAVVLGPDGLSRFEELRSREAAHAAMLYAFDLIEHDGEDMRNRRFLDRKAALARLLRNTEAGILLNEHILEDGPVVFAHACRLGAEGRWHVSIRPVPRLDQGPQSRQHRRAAREERDLEAIFFCGFRSY
jgi:bifunctional non-homologous end joining protein LigD